VQPWQCDQVSMSGVAPAAAVTVSCVNINASNTG
jgi:hypothetical protein